MPRLLLKIMVGDNGFVSPTRRESPVIVDLYEFYLVGVAFLGNILGEFG